MDKIGQLLRTLLDLLRGFMETMFWAGPPVDWDQQCQEALAEAEAEAEPWRRGYWYR